MVESHEEAQFGFLEKVALIYYKFEDFIKVILKDCGYFVENFIRKPNLVNKQIIAI